MEIEIFNQDKGVKTMQKKKTKGIDPNQSRINPQEEWARISENGQGPCIWSICTDLPLDAVMAAGFLHDQSKHGAARLDRVMITAEANSETPTLARAIVIDSRIGSPVLMELEPGSEFKVTLPNLSPFEILGLTPQATADQIETAYRALARKRHPDKTGGDKEAMQRLNTAKEECLRIASSLRAA
jgi:DnaJ-domain-containing protein 1